MNGTVWGSDGIVDLVFMIYRNSTILMSAYTGIAHLSMSSTYATNDGVSIQNYNYIGGGAQMRGGFNGRDYTTYYIAAHELGHYLFGGGHIDFISNLGLMTGLPYWNDDRGMCAWERMHLGWLTPQNVSSDCSVTMTDYMQTRNVLRIPLTANEYFLIENRRRLSPHDAAKANGFYIYHVTSNSWVPTIDVECADGNWNFTVNTSTQTVSRMSQNYASSNDEMNFYQDIGGIQYRCIQPYYPQDDAGGDVEDAFDLTFNNVFSPRSNPSSTNRLSTNFSVQVTGENTLTFYFTDPYAGAPSKPQNLATSANPGDNKVRITWDANTETDINSYEISRKVNYAGWSVIATTTNTFYVDTQWQYDQGSTFDVSYRIRAKDNSNNYSVYSNLATCHPWPIGKRTANFISSINPIDYILSNYPNPFNPITKISFSIPEMSFVTLKIYDILGSEITSLLNEIKPSGIYEKEFDASQLPSGTYIYRLTAGKQQIIKKMQLIK